MYYVILFSLFFLMGCSSPHIELEEQRVVANIDRETTVNKTFLNESDQKIYIFVEEQSVTGDSTNQIDLPRSYTVLIRSLLSDFKRNKVEVIVSENTYKSYLKNKSKRPYTYQLIGALTQYDKNVLSQSSSFRIGVNIGGGESETDGDIDYTDSSSKSVLGADLFLLQEDAIVEKSSSQITMQSVNEAHNFAIMLNGGQIGYRARTQLQDGLDSSIRKMFASSLRDLISKAVRQKSTL